jgi:hypothetical protein
MICDVFGDESQLLLCDGCNHSCHVCCAGLDNIPAGAWFCYTCQEDAQIMHDNYQPRRIARRATSRGTRGRRGNDPQTAWARLWRSVASSTGIDLEHPFDEEEVPRQEQLAQNRSFRQWQRRFQVAGRVAGASAANRFRELAPTRQPAHQPEPESQEEIRAWNAFEKARLLQQDDQSRGRRKRRSRDTSPDTEAAATAERKRKRPRILRITDPDLTDSTIGEPSRPTRMDRPGSISSGRLERPDTNGGPTFLQSLLDEVETHTSTHPSAQDNYDANGEYFPYGLDRSSSPDGSPCASSRASPRAMTPPPPRPNSPTLLTTSIEPIYPPAPEFRPNSPHVEDSVERARSRQRSHAAHQSPGSSPVRPAVPPISTSTSINSEPSSPKPVASAVPPSSPIAATPTASSSNQVAITLDLKTKTEIQGLVKTVLRPLYNSNEVTSDQYTDINRDVSRKLYDKIGNGANLESSKEKWQKIAEEEVLLAVQSLKSNLEPNKSPSDSESFNNLTLRGVVTN